jgi:peptidoglycan-associated lipoprotein
MKKLLVSLAALGILAGCASQAPKEQDPVPVVSGKPSEPPVEPVVKPKVVEQPKVTPVEVKPIAGNPLKDPGNILSKRSVFYDYDSNVVKDEFKPLVTAHARFLAQNRGRKIAIQGNTDERGSREYNIALGQRRAEAVKRVLTLQGAQEAQIEAVSLGEEKPRCEAQNEDCWAQNRRGEILYGGEY